MCKQKYNIISCVYDDTDYIIDKNVHQQGCIKKKDLVFSGFWGAFSRIKRPERKVEHPPHLAPRLRTSGSIPLLRLWSFMAPTEANVFLQL